MVLTGRLFELTVFIFLAAVSVSGAEQIGKAPPKRAIEPQSSVKPADTPEEECKRRRDRINRQGKPVLGLFKTGGRANAAMRAIPLAGSLTVKGAAASALYGKTKQELNYTIRETFVGNLIIRGSGDHEEYAIQTISTEIDVEHFNGRVCAKYTGSPPACVQWHPIDLWQIADGEEYPGRSDSVVTATGDGQKMTIRADGPVIEFGSSKGPVSIKPGCGGTLRETVKRDEVRQWLRRSAVQIKRETGQTVPGCRPGSSLILEMRIGGT